MLFRRSPESTLLSGISNIMISSTTHFGANNSYKTRKLDIETLVDTKLPASQSGLMKISTLLRDVNASAQKITQAINYEPALVARILRLANSSLFSLERDLTSVQQAIAAIGSKSVNEIVLMELASDTFSREIKKSFHARKIWEHSIVVALLAQELSITLGLRGTEEAFTCGLLHDIGKIILLINDFENYPSVLEAEEEGKLLSMENQSYGFNHAEVGSLVVKRWELPQEICSTILYHHNPSQSQQLLLISHIIDVADTIANTIGYGFRDESHDKIFNSESAIVLKLSESHFEHVWNNVESRIIEVLKSYT